MCEKRDVRIPRLIVSFKTPAQPLNVPLKEDDMPPGPSAAFRQIPGHFPLVGISVQTHRCPYAHELAPDGPDFLRLVLGERQVVRSDEEVLDELEGERTGVVSVPAQGIFGYGVVSVA